MKQTEYIFGCKPIAQIKDEQRHKAQRAEPVRRTPEIIKEQNDPVKISGSMLNSPAGEAIRLVPTQLCILCTTQSLCKSFAECILDSEAIQSLEASNSPKSWGKATQTSKASPGSETPAMGLEKASKALNTLDNSVLIDTDKIGINKKTLQNVNKQHFITIK